MKKLINMLFILATISLFAQIEGNKQIKTRTFSIKNVKQIKINFHANVIIDASAEESLTITTDANLFDLINKEVIDGTLILDQKEWIEPSQKSVIKIGAPYLNRVQQNTHDTTKIININYEELRIQALVGNIIIEGKTKELHLGSEVSNIDASKIIAEKAYVNLWSWGIIKVNVTDLLWADVSNNGKLYYVYKPKKLDVKTKKDGKVLNLYETEKIVNVDAKYINFKIKNNSFNRNSFEVIGPKQDGSKFGYGFAMMPHATRKETWTIGTKVYKVSDTGFKKLILTITKSNENQVVNLFN